MWFLISDSWGKLDNSEACAVCKPQVFKDFMSMERKSRMNLLDDFLFNPTNMKKGKRNIIVAVVAASGMG